MKSEYQIGAVADLIANFSKKKIITDSNEAKSDIVSPPTQKNKGKKRKSCDSNGELEKNTILNKDKKNSKKHKKSMGIEPELIKSLKNIKDDPNENTFESKANEQSKKDVHKNIKNNDSNKIQKREKNKEKKTGHHIGISNLRESTKKNKKQLKKKVKGKVSKISKLAGEVATTEKKEKTKSTDSKQEDKSEKDLAGLVLESDSVSKSVKDTQEIDSQPNNQAETKGFPKHLGDTSENISEDSKLNEEEESRTIFVGNLPLKITRSRVTNMFKPYGEVEAVRFRSIPVADIKLPRKACVKMNKIHDKRTNMNAYVRFKNIESVEKALEMNGHVISEHTIRVDQALKKTKINSHAIFIGNLPFEAEEEELRKAFEDCGEIINVRVIRDQHTNIGKGFAYVNFKSPDSVAFALELEDVKIRKREVRIKRSFDKNRPDKSFGRFNSYKPSSGNFQRNQGRFSRGGQSNQGSRGGFQGGSRFGGQRVTREVNNKFRGALGSRNEGGFKGRNEGRFKGRNEGGFKGRNEGGFKGRNEGGFKGRNEGGFKGRNEGGKFNKNTGSVGFKKSFNKKSSFQGSTVEEKGNRNHQKKKLNYDAFKKFIIAKKLTGGTDKKKGFNFLSSS